MVRVDVEKNVRFVDKVAIWRRDELKRLYPDMSEDEREHLASGADQYLVHDAAALKADDCPAALAYRILRPLPRPR